MLLYDHLTRIAIYWRPSWVKEKQRVLDLIETWPQPTSKVNHLPIQNNQAIIVTSREKQGGAYNLENA